MALSDDVVLNLVLKMKVDPAEAQRIASQGLGPVEAELRASLERQKQAHANAGQVMSEQGRFYAKQEIADAQNRTAQLAAAARVLSAEQSAAAKQLATEQSAASKSALMAQTLAARESAAAAKQSAAEQIAASRLAATAQIAASRDAATAARSAEKAERDKVASARATDAETQRMGRLMSQAYAENAARDAAAAKSKDAEIQRMGRAQSAAMVENAAREKAALLEVEEAHHRHIENIKNVAETAFIAYEVIAHGFETFKSLAESITKTINIYGALKGSIDAMREATGGQVADIDLITTKNRAFQKDLQLTDDQFGQVSAAALVFSHALGTDTKEALDQLIDGLATGRVKTLAAAGVVVDAKKVYEDYAKSIHIAVAELSEHQKKVALVEASLRAMNDKLIESGGEIHNFSSEWEKAQASMTNLSDEMKIGLGGVLTSLIGGFDNVTSYMAQFLLQWKVTFAEAANFADKALHPFTHINDGDGAIASAKSDLAGLLAERAEKNDPGRAAREAAEGLAKAKELKRLDENPSMSDLKIFGGKGLPFDAENAVGGSTEAGAVADTSFKGVDVLTKMFAKIANEERIAKESRENDLRDLEELLTDPYKHLDETIAAAQSRKGIDFSQRQSIFDAAQFGSAPGGAEHVGVPSDINGQEMGPVYRMAGKGTGEDRTKQAEQEFADAEVRMNKLAADQKELDKETHNERKKRRDQEFKEQEDLAAEADRMTRDMGGTVEDLAHGKVGSRGLFDKMLFGEEGIEAMLHRSRAAAEQLGDIGKQLHDTATSTGKAMEGALGKSIAASIGEAKNFKDVLKDTTHAVLMSLSEQAFVKSLMFGAEALGDLAMWNLDGAAKAGIASAAFAAVGVAAGLGARATYTAPSSGSSAGSTPTQSRSPSSSSSSGSSTGTGNVTLIINAPLGDKLAVGRAVNDALATYKQVTGREIGVYG